MSLQSAIKSAEDRVDPILPQSKLPFYIDAAEFRTNKKGTGMLSCRFKVSEGEFKGRTIFQDFILDHPTAYTCQLGAAAMREMLNAIHMVDEDDVEKIVGAEFDGLVEIIPAEGTYPAKNKIASFVEKEPVYTQKKTAAKPATSKGAPPPALDDPDGIPY